MIDTISFDLHSINEKNVDLKPNVKDGKSFMSDFNRALYERLLNYENIYVERTKQFINENVFQSLDESYFQSITEKKVGIMKRKGTFIETKDKGEFFFRPVRGNLMTPSSDYRVKFSVSENFDAINFDFSIPKYFYNHNIAQFLPNIDSKRYKNSPFSNREFYYQVGHLHDRLQEFIYTFFCDLSEILELPTLIHFDIRNVEIKRLDLCYNQLFPNHSMVLDYLDSQRKFYKTRTQKNTIIAEDRPTSFWYRHSTDGFYFKIYAKGEEFEATDMPRLLKENQNYFDSYYSKISTQLKEIFKDNFPDAWKKHLIKTVKNDSKIDDLIFPYYKTYLKNPDFQKYCQQLENYFPNKLSFLYNEANKILRYEMSFTRKYMSTLYKREVFRKNCPKWQKVMKSYNLIKRYDLLLSQGSIEKAKEFKRNNILGEVDRNNYELIDKSLHKKHKFHLLTDKKLHEHESLFLDYESSFHLKNYRCIENEKATLDKSFLRNLFKVFKEEIDYFQVAEFTEVKTVLERIDDYNKNAAQKVENYKNTFGESAFKKLTHTEKRKKGYSKLNKPRIKIVLDKLDKGDTIVKICQDLGMSKSAYHSLINDLKHFDLHKQTVKTKYNYRMITTNFKPYYDNFHLDKFYHRKLFSNPFMIAFDTVRPTLSN